MGGENPPQCATFWMLENHIVKIWIGISPGMYMLCSVKIPKQHTILSASTPWERILLLWICSSTKEGSNKRFHKRYKYVDPQCCEIHMLNNPKILESLQWGPVMKYQTTITENFFFFFNVYYSYVFSAINAMEFGDPYKWVRSCKIRPIRDGSRCGQHRTYTGMESSLFKINK